MESSSGRALVLGEVSGHLTLLVVNYLSLTPNVAHLLKAPFGFTGMSNGHRCLFELSVNPVSTLGEFVGSPTA